MNPAPKANHFDKTGTKQRRKSVLCDGSFLADLRACGYLAKIESGAHPRVGVHRSRLSPLNLPLAPYVYKPKAWRDTHEDLRGLFYAIAIRSVGNWWKFDLNFSQTVEASARAQGSRCIAWLHKRVSRSLRRKGSDFPSSIPFWFAIEESDKERRLHAHGEVAFDPNHKKWVRSALKLAGGPWDKDAAEFQLIMQPFPNLRGAGYCLKSVGKARPERRRSAERFGSLWDVAGFEGKAVTASPDLKRVAIKYHAAAVEEVVRFRRSGGLKTADATA